MNLFTCDGRTRLAFTRRWRRDYGMDMVFSCRVSQTCVLITQREQRESSLKKQQEG